MSENVTNLDIFCDRKCCECGKRGATRSGLCLGCATDAITGKLMKSSEGKNFVKTIETIGMLKVISKTEAGKRSLGESLHQPQDAQSGVAAIIGKLSDLTDAKKDGA